MARYSPTRTTPTTVPTVYDALNELIDRGHQTVQRRRTEGIQDERLERERRAAELSEALNEAGAYDAGIRKGEARTDDIPEEEDVFQGAKVGMQSQRTEAAPSIFQGERPGMASGTSSPNAQLAEEIGGLMERGRQPKPKLVARAGEFVPELGGYTDRNLTDQDIFGGVLPGQPERDPRQRPRPTDVQLTDDRYLDLTATPGARGARAEAQERALSMQQRLRLAQALQDMGASEEEAMLVFTDDQYAQDVMDRIEGRDRRFTEEELRAAGIDEDMIDAALRDPVLARQLMTGSEDGSGGQRPLTPTESRTRAAQARDEYLSEQIAAGERDPQRLLELAQEEFPDTPTTLRDIRAQLDAGEDEVYQETRQAILGLVHPVEYGGGPILNKIVDELARGTAKSEIERLLAEAYEGEEDHAEYRNALSYLNAVAAAEGFDVLLGGS